MCGRRPRALLAMGVLVALIALVQSACAGGDGNEEQAKAKEEANARPLPEEPQALRPGEYRTEEFKPSASFRVGEGWLAAPPEASDVLQLQYGQKTGLAFTRVQKVYKPATTTPTLVKAPEDLVGWYQHHPYLKTGKPEPIMVGGVKGVEFDVVAEVPEDHLSICGADCVDTIQYTGGHVGLFEGDKYHVIVLEDVKGDKLTIDYGGLATDFDKVAPEAQKLVNSVKWTGS